MKKSNDARPPTLRPKPGSRSEQAVKRVDDRHPYGAVAPTDKVEEARRRPDRSPAPPVELPDKPSPRDRS